MERRITSPTTAITRRQMTLVFFALALLCAAAFTIGVLIGKSVATCPDCLNDAPGQQAQTGAKTEGGAKTQPSGETPKTQNQQPQQNVQPPGVNPNLNQQGQPKSKEETAALEMAGGVSSDSKKQPTADAKAEDKNKKSLSGSDKKQTDAVSEDAVEKPVKQEGPFTVQLSAHVKKEQAVEALKNLGSIEGLTPFIVEAKSSGVKVYRIQIGKFQTKEEAKTFAETIAANKNIMGNVVPLGKK